MFFKLNVSGEKADLVSHIISKHPDNIFERGVNKRGRIVSHFSKYTPEKVIYEGYLENYSLPFYKMCRDENLSVYVNSEQYSVCPFNLELINTVFRSVLRGKCEGISEEDFNREYDINFKIGPFSLYRMEKLIESLKDLGYDIIKESFGPNENVAHVLNIIGKNNLTYFLQQIYVICYAYTNHLRFRIPMKQDIGKYAELSKGWIQDHPNRDYILNRLSKVKRNVKEFEGNLLRAEGVGEDEIKDIVKDKMESTKIRASEIRYQTIISLLVNEDSILDFGCASGNLINRLLKVRKPKKLVGFDSDKRCTRTTYARGKQQLRYYKNKETEFEVHAGSILYPDYSVFEGIDTVILAEVLEHFKENEVDRVLDIIFAGISPNKVIITTPNKDFNVNFKMEDNKLRHPDHKFELTKDEIKALADHIKNKYDYEYCFNWSESDKQENELYESEILYPKIDSEPMDEVSHIIYFQRTDRAKRNANLVKENEFLYSPFDLDASAYRLSSRTIREGSATFNHKVDPRWIISLTPTMSPADSSKIEGYIEHPYDAVNYYRNRGVRDLIVETKYMGSNTTIVATKEREISQKLFGSDDLINIYSRKGYRFFDDKKIENQIYEEIRNYMSLIECDVIALNTEILPWSYKAGVMIEKEFEKPGWCAYVDKFFHSNDTQDEWSYLQSLKNYSGGSDIKIYPFNIIMFSKFYKGKFRDVVNGYYKPHDYQLDLLESLWNKSNLFCPVECRLFSEGLRSDMDKIIEYWERLEGMGLEGVVIKPRFPTRFLDSGRYIQPALKCRTREYLRLIYGINYLDPENIKFLKGRKTAVKRKLAMQQFELSQKILYSFINMNQNQRLKYIFSFFGMERTANIDNTL